MKKMILAVVLLAMATISHAGNLEENTKLLKENFMKYGKDSFMKKMVDNSQSILPVTLDEHTKMVKIGYAAGTLRNTAQIYGELEQMVHDATDEYLEDAKDRQRVLMTNTRCTSPSTRAMINNGIIIQDYYVTSDFKYLFSFEIDENTCLKLEGN